MKPLLSIVVPVYNEEENIMVFYDSVTKIMEDLVNYKYEIIFIDDGSVDKTPIILQSLANRDKRVFGIILARNFGHQIALTCGIETARGDIIITMDGDMQHPPALIPRLISLYEDGYDVVQTIRDSTENVSSFKRFTSSIYYKVLQAIAEVPIREGGSDFRLITRQVADTLVCFKDKARFIRGIIGGIGYRQATLHFIAPPRYAGTSKFNLRKMLHFAVDGVLGFSRAPLRFALWTGFVMGGFSLFMTLYILYIYYFTDEAVSGWATIAISEFLLGGLSLVGIGILGEYIGRIFDEVKRRPLYWTRAEYGNSMSHKAAVVERGAAGESVVICRRQERLAGDLVPRQVEVDDESVYLVEDLSAKTIRMKSISSSIIPKEEVSLERCGIPKTEASSNK